MKYYAGIGSRTTPPDVQRTMTAVALLLREEWCLRSGGASGADLAFEAGAVAKQIFLPWRGFNGSTSTLIEPRIPDEAYRIASEIHPGWNYLSGPARMLMARNSRQILGPDLSDPVAFVLCWTPDGCESGATRSRTTGGTGQAISLATRYDVPVLNLANPDWATRMNALTGLSFELGSSPGFAK